VIASPKLRRGSGGPAYRYYAGFSDEFVRQLLTLADLTPDEFVLDAWNGSGTTTKVASEMSIPTIGLDINPVMVVVAKARLITEKESRDAGLRLETLLKSESLATSVADDDPLTLWFDPESVRLIRGAERIMRELPPDVPWSPVDVSRMSITLAHLYTALFLTIRAFIKAFVGSNPTWVKIPKGDNERLSVTPDELLQKLAQGRSGLAADPLSIPTRSTPVRIELASAAALPTDFPAAAFILTSPPYCTRIDYAIATRPELAVLGVSLTEQDNLRRRMLGTTTVPSAVVLDLASLGPTASELLDTVKLHRAKASRTYYWKWLAQYLAGYSASLTQITIHSAPSALCAVVVQDSHYKDILIDLAQISVELLELNGWRKLHNYSFHVATTMAGVNRGTRQYRDDYSATEQVIFFEKCEDSSTS